MAMSSFIRKSLGYLMLLLLPTSLLHADSFQKTDKGIRVEEDSNVFVTIPDDQRLKKVAGNVVTHEPETEYIDRKIKQMEAELATFQADIEKRLAALETKMDERTKDEGRKE